MYLFITVLYNGFRFRPWFPMNPLHDSVDVFRIGEIVNPLLRQDELVEGLGIEEVNFRKHVRLDDSEMREQRITILTEIHLVFLARDGNDDLGEGNLVRFLVESFASVMERIVSAASDLHPIHQCVSADDGGAGGIQHFGIIRVHDSNPFLACG